MKKINPLIIREPNIEDKNRFILAMQRNHHFHHPWIKSPQTEEEFEKYIHRSQQDSEKYFLACDILGNIIGVFNISGIILGAFQSAYMGFYVVVDYAGQGYMSSGLKLVLKTIFEEIKLHRIGANIQPDNTSSINLVKAHNFRKEGYSPRYLHINNQWRDHERWALTYEDWNSENKLDIT